MRVGKADSAHLIAHANDVGKTHVRAPEVRVLFAAGRVEADEVGALFLRLKVIPHGGGVVAAVVQVENRGTICVLDMVDKRLVFRRHMCGRQRCDRVRAGLHGFEGLQNMEVQVVEAFAVDLPVGALLEESVGLRRAVDVEVGTDHIEAVARAAHGELLRVEVVHMAVRKQQIPHAAEIEPVGELVQVGVRRQVD